MMREASNNYTKFWMEDGIMHSNFVHHTHLDLDLCIALINFRQEFSEGEKQYWLYDLDKLQTMTKDAKDYAAKYGVDYLHAAAIIVHSHLQKFIINTFIIVKKPKVKTRIFTDKAKAKKWLLEIKAKNAV
jgi:hypothetical protein